MNKLKKELKDWAGALLFAVLVATPLRWAIGEPYKIPTPSMEGSLLVGDFLYVSKLHYGARTAKTLLQIPLTFQKIWGTEIPSYVDWISAPFLRGPGISQVKRNDNVVFNFPGELQNPVDMRTYYIKRCIAVAGDTIEIRNKQVFINGIVKPLPLNAQSSYFIKSHSKINNRIFKKVGISEVIPNNNGYYVHASKESISALKKYDFISEVVELSNDNSRAGTFPQSENISWTADNFGPLYIPKANDVINLTKENIEMYKSTILNYDLNDNVEIMEDKLYLDEVLQSTYTFKQNYYFMMGDNRHNSLDSRYWGFVPMDHVVGKALYTWLSIDEKESLLSSIRWERVFSSID
jgi:signal peptidase I